MTDSRFASPWTIEKILGGGLVVRDANGQSLAYVMSRENPSDARMAKMLTDEEAQWIANNIAKLPDLLGAAETMPSFGFPAIQPIGNEPWRGIGAT
jgi:hypothetical protein